jgi:hypothetical protein
MEGLLRAIESFPAALYTVLLGLVLLYWLFVVVGAVDLDALGGAEHGMEGVAKGVLEGASDAALSALDGAADGVTHATEAVGAGMEGAEGVEGAGTSGVGVSHAGGVLSSLGVLHLRKVPVTVAGSLVVIYGWLVAVLAQVTAGARWTQAGLPGWAFGSAVSVLSLGLAVRFAGWTARPMVPLFAARPASTRDDLMGREAEVTTGRLDAGFGQVLVSDGGAGLLIDARFEGGTLRRGDRVVVTYWDGERNVVQVEPLERAVRVRLETERLSAEPAPGGAVAASEPCHEGAALSGDAVQTFTHTGRREAMGFVSAPGVGARGGDAGGRRGGGGVRRRAVPGGVGRCDGRVKALDHRPGLGRSHRGRRRAGHGGRLPRGGEPSGGVQQPAGGAAGMSGRGTSIPSRCVRWWRASTSCTCGSG